MERPTLGRARGVRKGLRSFGDGEGSIGDPDEPGCKFLDELIGLARPADVSDAELRSETGTTGWGAGTTGFVR